MATFFITYGGAEAGHPHEGGWTVVEARDQRAACLLWEMVYRGARTKEGYLLFSSIYTMEQFFQTPMPVTGNRGFFAWDHISLQHSKLANPKAPAKKGGGEHGQKNDLEE